MITIQQCKCCWNKNIVNQDKQISYRLHATFWVETQVSIAIYNSSVVAVQLLSCVRLFVTPWTAASQVSLSFTISQSCSNSCPLSWWCHTAISSFVVPFNLFQHQVLFQWVSSSHQVAKVLELQLQHQSFQWIFRTDFL